MQDCDVLLFGGYFCDLIFTGLPEMPRLGADIFGNSLEIAPGGAYILTVALHRLGVKTLWAAYFGNDLFSQFVLEEARKEGLDESLFRQFPMPYRTISVSFSFAHDRGFISHSDPSPGEIPGRELIAAVRPRWVVNAPFDGSAESRSFIDFVHQNGGRVYTDCQYTTQTLDEPGLTDTLAKIDIFAPNQSEACQITGAPDPGTAAEILARYCPLVVVKCGAQGVIARSGSQVWTAPAMPAEVVDTTGAGDCFNAGFLAACLRGEPMETCLRYGNICGGLSVTRRGGTSAAPTLEQLKTYL